MKRASFFVLSFLIAAFFTVCLSGCDKEVAEVCEHSYVLTDWQSSTCTVSGYRTYVCKYCNDEKTEVLNATGHKPGLAATTEAPCVCTVCGEVLVPRLPVTEYDADDTMLNYYFGNAEPSYSRTIDTQYRGKKNVSRTYYNSAGKQQTLQFGMSLLGFYSHTVESFEPLETEDGKTFSVVSGFRPVFEFDLPMISADNTVAVTEGDYLNNFSEDALLRAVAETDAGNDFGKVYEVVDFSSSVLEIAKKTTTGYETLYAVDSAEEWQEILDAGTFALTDEGRCFFDNGEYLVSLRFAVSWVADNYYPLYYNAEDAAADVARAYPYGFFEDVYDFFYVKVENANSGVLLPDEAEDGRDYFYQLRTGDGSSAFVSEGETVKLGSEGIVYLDTLLECLNGKYYYKDSEIESFELVFSYKEADAVNYTFVGKNDLLELLGSNQIANLIIEKQQKYVGKQCEFKVVYSLKSQNGIVELTDVYHITINW